MTSSPGFLVARMVILGQLLANCDEYTKFKSACFFIQLAINTFHGHVHLLAESVDDAMVKDGHQIVALVFLSR